MISLDARVTGGINLEPADSMIVLNAQISSGNFGLEAQEQAIGLALTVGGLTIINKRGATGPLAATAIPTSSLVYITQAGTLALADASAEGMEAIGFTTEAFAPGEATTFFGGGDVLPGLSGLVTGTTYFLAPTAGALGAAPTAPGQVVQAVGVAISSTQLLFNLSPPITL